MAHIEYKATHNGIKYDYSGDVETLGGYVSNRTSSGPPVRVWIGKSEHYFMIILYQNEKVVGALGKIPYFSMVFRFLRYPTMEDAVKKGKLVFTPGAPIPPCILGAVAFRAALQEMSCGRKLNTNEAVDWEGFKSIIYGNDPDWWKTWKGFKDDDEEE